MALISDTSKVMLKTLHVRLQQYVNCELPDIQDGIRKARGTRAQITNIHWVIKKEENSRKPLLVVLKLNIQKTKIMTSGPSTSWQIDGETMEAMRYFTFWGSKITADGDWSHKIRLLLLRRKVVTNLDSRFKSRDITVPTKLCSSTFVKAMVFPVVMYGCETWTIRKVEHGGIDVFDLWSWRRLLSVPLTARRSNQSILKKISPECSLEGLKLKLKLQYFGHLMGRTDSLKKTLMLEKIVGGKKRGWQRMRWLAGISDSMDMSLSKHWDWWWTGRSVVLQCMWLQSWTWLSFWTDWTERTPLNTLPKFTRERIWWS